MIFSPAQPHHSGTCSNMLHSAANLVVKIDILQANSRSLLIHGTELANAYLHKSYGMYHVCVWHIPKSKNYPEKTMFITLGFCWKWCRLILHKIFILSRKICVLCVCGTFFVLRLFIIRMETVLSRFVVTLFVLSQV